MTELEKMLAYYGYKTIKEFGEALGYYNEKDTERALKDIYEEDNAPYRD